MLRIQRFLELLGLRGPDPERRPSLGSAIPTPPAGCTGTTTNYYATAKPLSFGSTGTRSFATTEQGTIFYTNTAAAPPDPIPAAATPIQ